jgi:FkbM family methyltransferase
MGFTFSQQQQQQIEWTVDLEKGVITTPQGINFDIESVDLEIFAETFLYDVHFVALNLEGKAVVDLGGFVGDTALYYASRGARVFVLEPNPVNYKFLTKNLELNPQLKDRITAYHQAVGPHGKMRFRVADGVCGEVLDVSQQSQDEETFTEVDSLTLGDIVKETGLTNLFLLKSDCKGYEVELVKDPAISSFSVVKMEYTESLIKTGGPGSLIAELRKRGFSNFRVFKHNFRTYDLKSHGTIMASK